jgi:hypothetical protein
VGVYLAPDEKVQKFSSYPEGADEEELVVDRAAGKLPAKKHNQEACDPVNESMSAIVNIP